jgi:hypothetical protein
MAGVAFSALAQDGKDKLSGPDTFAGIEDESARSAALFEEMGKVLQHPRCVNCHPKGDRPLQGNDSHLHQPPVQRGLANIGVPAMYCTTCHGSENVAFSTGPGSIPGHAPWMLAPIEMAWEGKTLAEICAQLQDPARNGHRTLDKMYDHMANDGLVGWGWHPGPGRDPAPGDQQTFGALAKAWIDSGAACPQG